MPVVTIQQSPGRSKEQKQLLIQRITEAYELPSEAVTVFFQNFDDDHWGKAGKLRCDRKQCSLSRIAPNKPNKVFNRIKISWLFSSLNILAN